MKQIFATLSKQKPQLSVFADAVNNGRTDGIYFYVNDTNVSVSHPHTKLTEARQIEELEWFLSGLEYTISD